MHCTVHTASRGMAQLRVPGTVLGGTPILSRARADCCCSAQCWHGSSLACNHGAASPRCSQQLYVTANDVSSQLQRHYQLSAVCEDSSVPSLLTPAVCPGHPAPRDTGSTSTAPLVLHRLINRDCITQLVLALTTPSRGHPFQPGPGVLPFIAILCGILCHHLVNR